jgi:hypothetical protein
MTRRDGISIVAWGMVAIGAIGAIGCGYVASTWWFASSADKACLENIERVLAKDISPPLDETSKGGDVFEPPMQPNDWENLKKDLPPQSISCLQKASRTLFEYLTGSSRKKYEDRIKQAITDKLLVPGVNSDNKSIWKIRTGYAATTPDATKAPQPNSSQTNPTAVQPSSGTATDPRNPDDNVAGRTTSHSACLASFDQAVSKPGPLQSALKKILQGSGKAAGDFDKAASELAPLVDRSRECTNNLAFYAWFTTFRGTPSVTTFDSKYFVLSNDSTVHLSETALGLTQLSGNQGTLQPPPNMPDTPSLEKKTDNVEQKLDGVAQQIKQLRDQLTEQAQKSTVQPEQILLGVLLGGLLAGIVLAIVLYLRNGNQFRARSGADLVPPGGPTMSHDPHSDLLRQVLDAVGKTNRLLADRSPDLEDLRHGVDLLNARLTGDNSGGGDSFDRVTTTRRLDCGNDRDNDIVVAAAQALSNDAMSAYRQLRDSEWDETTLESFKRKFSVQPVEQKSPAGDTILMPVNGGDDGANALMWVLDERRGGDLLVVLSKEAYRNRWASRFQDLLEKISGFFKLEQANSGVTLKQPARVRRQGDHYTFVATGQVSV